MKVISLTKPYLKFKQNKISILRRLARPDFYVAKKQRPNPGEASQCYFISINGIRSSSKAKYMCTTDRSYSVCTTSKALNLSGIGNAMASFMVRPLEAALLRLVCNQSR